MEGMWVADMDVWQSSNSLGPIKLKVVRAVLAQPLTCYLPINFFVSVPLATLVQTSLGLYRSPTGPGR